ALEKADFIPGCRGKIAADMRGCRRASGYPSPAALNLRARAPPMLPVPMTPIFIAPLPLVRLSDYVYNPIIADMRYEPEHKTRTRERIVRNAARKLRTEGLSGPGVASLMKASGLTVGGFYKHFGSKDEL